jgi:hypothetical protein
MPTYIEYQMEDGSTVLVEAESSMGGVVKASRGGVDVVQTGKKFTDAVASIRGSLKAMVMEFDALKIEEAEVKFGLKAVGEAGVFAVGKVGGEMNYEVTLKWKKPPDEKPKPKSRK